MKGELYSVMASVKSSRSSTVVDSSRSGRDRSKTKDDIEKSSSRSTGRGGGDTLPKIGKDLDERSVAEYDDLINRPVMFGDPFGNRGDYSKGRQLHTVLLYHELL